MRVYMVDDKTDVVVFVSNDMSDLVGLFYSLHV